VTATASRPGQLKETERVEAGGRGPFGGGMVGQKAHNFRASSRRLLSRLSPQRAKVAGLLVLAVLSVALTALGPTILGRATDLIFAGLVGSRLPDGITKAQAVEQLRAAGDSTYASMVSAMDVTPGQGVDFGAVRNVLLLALGVYVVAAVLSFGQGYLINEVVQSTVRRMRGDVEDKVHRLPLSYFDRQPRGELLSRVTNDIDNISQSLQQTMSQLVTSLLTVVAVLAMMFWISPLLALVALISVPISMLLAGTVMKRSRAMFIDQWRAPRPR